MIFNFNLHYSDCHKNRNRKLSINHKLTFSNSLSVERCMYVHISYIFIYINTIVKSFCSFPLFFFPLCHVSCSPSALRVINIVLFLFLFLFIFKWNWSTARAFDSDWRWNERTAAIGRPSAPSFACCLVILSPLRYLLPLVPRYTKTLHTSAWNRHQAFTLFPHSVADKIDVEMIYEYCFQLSHFLFYNFGF